MHTDTHHTSHTHHTPRICTQKFGYMNDLGAEEKMYEGPSSAVCVHGGIEERGSAPFPMTTDREKKASKQTTDKHGKKTDTEKTMKMESKLHSLDEDNTRRGMKKRKYKQKRERTYLSCAATSRGVPLPGSLSALSFT